MMLLVEPLSATPARLRELMDEKDALQRRLDWMCAFVASEEYRALESTDRFLVDRQLSHMRDYAHILFMRVARFG
ncbi:hypothetical protein CBA19CS22_38045 [Caballeronia novacaledonica]|uniref:Uncharacterized protein n=1 Tax=Caballeronia novacaledonica TaxID=1544861 RepID=A0ACB5R551_9BURK|nr:hypothetical protein CBA19CS22_38045 [Caballeronia novacaledonica]